MQKRMLWDLCIFILPNDIIKAKTLLGNPNIKKEFIDLRKRILDSNEKVISSNYLNNYFDKFLFIKTLYYIINNLYTFGFR